MKRRTLAAMGAGLLVAAGIAVAADSLAPWGGTETGQRRRRGGGVAGFGRSVGSPGDLPIENKPYDGSFTFLRVRFEEGMWRYGRYAWGLDMGWNHDYPRAEHNLSLMLEELTTMPVSIVPHGGNIHSFADPEIFDYPFVYISEPGWWTITQEEVDNLRDYLAKGGFIMVDDMEYDDTDEFYRVMQKAIPGSVFEILDTTHPIFNCFFQITQEDILNQRFNYYGRNGGPVIYGIYEDNDPSKRLLAVVNHNQDIGESWEFSNVGYVPIEQANNSYKIGINYIICSMLQ